MNKRDYFLAAMRAQCYRHREWVYDAFGFQETVSEAPKSAFPFSLWRTEDGYKFLDPVTGKVESLEGTLDDEPAFNFYDGIDLKKGEVPNLKVDVKTTYGNVLYNWIVLVWPTGDKIDFVTGEIKVSKLEKSFFTMEDQLPEGKEKEPGKLYVDEYLNFQSAVRYTEEFANLCVPSATPRNVVTDPRIPEFRAKLIADNREHLNDPAVEAKITKALVDMDRAWIAADPEGGFYMKDKSFNVTRKKMYLIQGTESGFEATPEANMIETSLEDGWDVNKLPEMNNSLRNGSFSRGAMTALGGEIVKTLLRITQNSTITEGDCGDTMGLPVLFTEDSYLKYVDRYYLTTTKKPIYIDEAIAKTLIGKTVDVRSPWSCKTEGYNYCTICMGKAIGSTPKAIGVYVSDVGSSLLSMFLALMHGKSTVTKKYILKDALT
jgi:hypothetical protein